MTLTYYGQACILVEFEKTKLLFDPFISGNPLAKHIDIVTLKTDYILVTHGHQDHILDLEDIAKHNPNAVLISNFEIINKFEYLGLKSHAMNIGGQYKFEFGLVKMVNALHSSSFPDGTYGGNPAGFVISNHKFTIYIAGDTALTGDMKLIPKTCPKLDLAVLPIGDNYTMGYKDAFIASQYIECDTIMGCHYDTFPAITINHQAAIDYFYKRNKALILKKIGEQWQPV